MLDKSEDEILEQLEEKKEQLFNIQKAAKMNDLRDQFAMAALTTLVTDYGDEGKVPAAQSAYEFADEMLKAREKI